jgi:hypothetical protein
VVGDNREEECPSPRPEEAWESVRDGHWYLLDTVTWYPTHHPHSISLQVFSLSTKTMELSFLWFGFVASP